MKLYLKVIGGVHVILSFLKSSPAAQTAQKMAALGTGTGAPQMDQRLLTNTWPKTRHTISIQANTNKSYEIVHQYIKTAH